MLAKVIRTFRDREADLVTREAGSTYKTSKELSLIHISMCIRDRPRTALIISPSVSMTLKSWRKTCCKCDVADREEEGR